MAAPGARELARSRLAEAGLFVVAVLALIVPALINRAPLVFYADTRTYYTSGRTAIERVIAMLHPGSGSGSAIEETLRMARGVRSAYYALFEYILANIGSLWLVIIVQAAIAAAMLRLMVTMMCPNRPAWQATVAIIGVALFTTQSWIVSCVMPDVFTGTLTLALIFLALFWERLNRLQRSGIFLILCVSLVMHINNLPTAVGLLVVAAFLRWRPWAYLTGLSAVALAVVALLAVGVMGFKEWSISPQSPPFLMARIIADGPGRLYLQEHCPAGGWAMCRHLDRLNVSDNEFLWSENGVYSAPDVSPEERAALRAEDKTLFVRAALEHPWLTLERMSLNYAVQVGMFTLNDFPVPAWATYTASDMTLWFPLGLNAPSPPWQMVWTGVHYGVVLLSLGYVVTLAARGLLTRDQRDFVILTLAAALLSAVAGALSDVSSRYEARAMWLVPLAAILVFMARRPEVLRPMHRSPYQAPAR